MGFGMKLGNFVNREIKLYCKRVAAEKRRQERREDRKEQRREARRK